jgi:hypothetical protein
MIKSYAVAFGCFQEEMLLYYIRAALVIIHNIIGDNRSMGCELVMGM